MEGNGDNKFQLIRDDQTFNERGMQAFIRESRELSSCGVNYSVISIIGPQSSGKSTLLNHIFETTFAVMNEEKGRSQTTKGIWMAKCTKPCILILDIEGTDGRERGQEDTSFENRSALFSLSVSDIVMINMWYQEIGRVNGAGIPLLQLVFRERVRLNLPQRQTTLLVVVRDYNFKTKLEAARKQIGDILNEIWTTITKQAGRSNLQFSEYFKYDVVPVPHLELQADDFREKAKELRELFSKGVVAESSRVPISGLTMNIKQIWSVIHENQDLNIPSIRVMVSQHMCSQIVKEKLQSFQLDESYKKFLNSLDTTSAQEFRVQVENLIDTCMTSYLEQTEHYDENARVKQERELKSELYKGMFGRAESTVERMETSMNLDGKPSRFIDVSIFSTIMQPEHEKMIKRLAVEIFESFRQEAHDMETLNVNKPVEIFQQKCAEVTINGSNWNCAMVQNDLLTDVTKHIDLLVADAKIEREKLLLAQSKCFEIANEKFQSFKSSQDYESLLRDIKSGQVEGFTNNVKNLVASCLQEYGTMTSQYDEKFRHTNEEWLKTELYKLTNEPYQKLINRKYKKCWASFAESVKSADDLYNASTSALTRFKHQCEDVTLAEFGWKYQKFVRRMKDDMIRKIEEVNREREKEAEEAQTAQPFAQGQVGNGLEGLAAGVITGALTGLVNALNNIVVDNTRAGGGVARRRAKANTRKKAHALLSVEEDGSLHDDSEDEF